MYVNELEKLISLELYHAVFVFTVCSIVQLHSLCFLVAVWVFLFTLSSLFFSLIMRKKKLSSIILFLKYYLIMRERKRRVNQ